MTTYSDLSKETRSQKSILAICQANERLSFFDLYSGNIYSKQVKFYVVGVSVNGQALTKKTSVGSMSAGCFFYEETTKKLFVQTPDNSSPTGNFVVVSYEFHWSTLPFVLPRDLNNGFEVEFDSLINSIGDLKLELDYESTGIALESTSSLNLINNSGEFDFTFDTLIFENQPIRFYSWFPKSPISEAKLIFKGLVNEKTFNSKEVRFTLKDEFYKLRNKVSINLFSETDGSFNDSLLLRPKRRLYGKFERLKCEGITKQKGKFNLTGTLAGTLGGNSLVGTSTEFLKELCVGDKLIINNNGSTIEVGVQDIQDDFNLTISETLQLSFSGLASEVETQVFSKYFNRKWQIAGHALCETIHSITELVDLTTIVLDSAEDLQDGDTLEILGSIYLIERISDNRVVLNQALSPIPTNGVLVYKKPVQKAFNGKTELVLNRDFSILNNSSNCVLVIDELAEFNTTRPIEQPYILQFNNGSRSVSHSGSATFDLRTIVNPRDFIKPNSVFYSNWYEVLTVNEGEIVLREAFAEANINSHFLVKNINYINDESIIAVNCIGKANESGGWIKYPSQAVRDLLINDAGILVNETTFNDAKDEAEFLLSYAIPYRQGEDAPSVRDAITKINESVFGSLYFNTNFEFCYSIIHSHKPESLTSLMDDDIVDFEVQTRNSIINSALIKYAQKTDLQTGESAPVVKIVDSEFVNRLIGIKNQRELETVLFYEDQANDIGERVLFFNSLTNSIVRVKAKLNMALVSLNDPFYLNLSRLYKRFAGRDRRKIGVVNYISKNESNVELHFNDLGGVFNRVPSIAPDSIAELSTASENEIVKFGFICDDINETPSETGEESFLGSNLIG